MKLVSVTELSVQAPQDAAVPTEGGRTHIERLSFDANQKYEAIEAAIHLNRYLASRDLCSGKTVLDAACGEGYGAALLERWGAKSVDGVDISTVAVGNAQRFFQSDRVRFHLHDVQKLDELFGAGQFDMAVSFETIEHVQDPKAFLQALKKVVRPGGPIIVSCPNDHWYYKRPEERNPFHVAKYTFRQFQALCEEVLGPAEEWLLGMPVVGFCNVRVDSNTLTQQTKGRHALFEFEQPSSTAVPADDKADETNCSYFVGVWGRQLSSTISATFAPMSMDSSGPSHRQADVEHYRDQMKAALRTAEEATARANTLEREARTHRMQNLVLRGENHALRSEIHDARVRLTQGPIQSLPLTPKEMAIAVSKRVLPTPVRAKLNRLIGRNQ